MTKKIGPKGKEKLLEIINRIWREEEFPKLWQIILKHCKKETEKTATVTEA